MPVCVVCFVRVLDIYSTGTVRKKKLFLFEFSFELSWACTKTKSEGEEATKLAAGKLKYKEVCADALDNRRVVKRGSLSLSLV